MNATPDAYKEAVKHTKENESCKNSITQKWTLQNAKPTLRKSTSVNVRCSFWSYNALLNARDGSAD
jgi:hypothetical protein